MRGTIDGLQRRHKDVVQHEHLCLHFPAGQKAKVSRLHCWSYTGRYEVRCCRSLRKLDTLPRALPHEDPGIPTAKLHALYPTLKSNATCLVYC